MIVYDKFMFVMYFSLKFSERVCFQKSTEWICLPFRPEVCKY